MNALQVSIVRHTKNYEAMLEFYRDNLGMQITEEWDEPDDRGTLLAFDGKAGSTVIEVIDLEDAPWGHRSFGIDDPDGFRIWFYHDMNK